MAAQQAQFQAQQKLAASQLALPQVLATINAGLAAGTPWKQIEEQIKAVEGQSKIIEAFRATGQSPDATLAAFNQATLNEQAKNRAQEGGAFFSSTRKGLLDEIEADQTRIAVMQQDIAVGKSYEQTQRDIAVALELVKLHQNDVTASLDASKVAELEKLITDKAELDKAADDMAKQQQLAENISSDITSAFQSMAQNIGNAFSIMRSTVLGIVNDIAKEILRRQVVKPLAEMINKWLGGILGTGADKDKTIKANNVYVNGRLVGGGGQEGAGGVGGAAGSIWGLGNDGWLPGIVGGGSIDKAAQDALGKGEINANDVIWKSMEGEAGQASGGGIFSGISNFFSGITSKIGSVFSGLFSGGGGMFSSLFSGIGSIFSGGSGILSSLMGFLPFLHSGGIAGAASSYRVASIGAFAGAPRFHSGLMPGEIAAILKDDEGVFTKDQMQALGRGRGGITIINNVQTPDLAGFQRTRDQRAVNDRISMEVAHRRYG
jgi:hypothetical protein